MEDVQLEPVVPVATDKAIGGVQTNKGVAVGGPAIIEADDPFKTRTTTEFEGRYVDRAKENKQEFDAEDGFAVGSAIKRSFLHGDNIAVNITKSLSRAWESGDEDPSWNKQAKDEWLKANEKGIPATQAWRYYGTRNKEEADLLKVDQAADLEAMQINEKLGGFRGFAAAGIAGLVDIDTPLTLMTGGISASAKAGISTTRRLLTGGVSGAALGVTMGAIDFVVNPNAESESLALYGLMGAGFGLIGAGRAGKVAGSDLLHGVKTEAVEELGERLNREGREMPRDPVPHSDPDPYGFNAVQEVIVMPEGKTTVRMEDAGSGDNPIAPRSAKGDEIIEEKSLPAEDLRGPALARNADDIIEEGTEAAPVGRGPVLAKAGDIVGEGSLGAKGPVRPGLEGIENPQYKEMAWKADQANKSIGMNAIDDPEYNTKNAVTKAAGIAGDRFSRFAQKLGISTDWDNFMRSDSAIAKKFAYDMFESASGIIRNYTSAAALMEVYRKELGGTFQPFVDHMRSYGAEVHGTNWKDNFFTDKGHNATKDFNEQVVTELMARRYGGQGAAHPSVKAAADVIDKTFALEVDVAQGRGGQTGIKAYADMKKQNGYFPQAWSGEQMLRMLDKAEQSGGITLRKRTKAMIRKAIEEDYARMHPLMKPDDRRIYAEAVVDRALINRQSIGRDILGLLSGDERDFVKSAFMRNGKNEAEADRIIDSLIGSRESKGRPGQTQERIDVDFRSVSSNGIKMMDLLDTDVFGMMHKRMARVSGQAALARKGITSREDFELVKGASIAEQEAKRASRGARPTGLLNSIKQIGSEPKAIDGQYWDDVYSYFNGTAVAGGVSPTYARIKKLTGLATMNQLGLTSMSETGAIIGTVGWQHFARHAGQAFNEAIRKADSPLSAELKHMHVYVPEESVWRPDMVFDSEKVHAASELMQKADLLLNKGQRAQGYLSGFFHVRQAQQKIAITSATARVFEGMKGNAKQFSHERLHDMGLDVKNWQKYVDDGTVEFNPQGELVKMNLDRWKEEDVEVYRASMARATNQLIQKAMAGESNVLFHKDGLAQLFWQFKSFPLLAVEKQFNRNMRMADSAAMQTFFFGLITAATAWSTKQVINGNTDNLTASKIARGALNYSNMSGWLPMWVDPTAGLLGLGDYNLSGYNGRGGGSIISTPAAFGVLDKLVQAPVSALKVATPFVDYSNSDIRNLQTIPLLGNAFGVAFLLNQMKHEPKRKKKEPTKETVKTPAEPKKAPAAKPFDASQAGSAVVQDLEIAQ